MEYLIKDIGYSCDIAYIPDGGGDFNILTEEKGALELKLTAYGRTAHAAYLWRGSNAIVKLYELYRKIIEFYPLPKSLDDWKTSVNLSKIQGGDALNKVPGEASMFLNIRFPYPVTAKDIIREIEKIIGNDHIKLEKIFDGSSFYSDPQNEYIQTYKAVAEKCLKREVGFAKAPGTADARFLSEKGVPVIITRCNGGGMHSSDEWVSLSSLIKQYEMLIEFLRAL
jgi:succinyl-diaminopimelate desuccinylase